MKIGEPILPQTLETQLESALKRKDELMAELKGAEEGISDLRTKIRDRDAQSVLASETRIRMVHAFEMHIPEHSRAQPWNANVIADILIEEEFVDDAIITDLEVPSVSRMLNEWATTNGHIGRKASFGFCTYIVQALRKEYS